MSILRHFNKHQGWHNGKRTYNGGGGGSWNPVSWVEDAASSVGDGLASIDPGPAIGQGLSEVDTFVNREIPGGWTLPAAVAAAYATGYIDPSLFASEAAATAGAEAGAGAIATEAGQTAFFDALASGATSSEAVSAGLAADAAVAGAGAGAFTDANLGSTGLAQELGLEGSSTGLTDLSGNQGSALLESMGLNTSGMSAADVLSNANRLKNIAKLLTGSESNVTKVFSQNTPTAQQWAQQAAQNFAQYTPEQFGGYYQMNKNPFTFQNPLANALKGSSGLDVSGTGGQSLNTQGQATNLAKLLA